ncbi:unnamed protein product [Dibothriocephalus latus]|uniref:Uncharacterized protein n=1 Tax=Dibothriocephalus latus TaxID=60516 RepID=A0A3P7NSJ2_DIBLA|nr:unnamed protein product [Dibothriocephalus latus]
MVAFVAYTFPVMVVLPVSKVAPDGSSSADGFLTTLTRLADKCAILAWLLVLFTRDCNFDYWQKHGVDFYLQVRFLLDDVTVITSILVGSSLPWLGYRDHGRRGFSSPDPLSQSAPVGKASIKS